MSMLKNNYYYNISEEIFGATVFDLVKGKRYYIDKKELANLYNNELLPSDICREKVDINRIKIIKIWLGEKTKNFSFADTVFIEVTRKCNLRCSHCLNNSGVLLEKEMTHEEILNLVDSLVEAGIQDIRFTGGEALTSNYIYDYISYALSKGVAVSLASNGTLINAEVAKKLATAGLKKCVISIDGTKKSNDMIRGKGAYDRTLKAIKYLKTNNIDVRINSVVLKSNIDDIIKLAENMDKMKIKMYIRRFVNSGRGENLKNMWLNYHDYEYLRNQLCNILKNGYVDGHYLHDGDGVKLRMDLPFKVEGCRAGKRSFVIAPNGDVFPCGFLAAQGFKPISNIRKIENWRKFWYDIKNEKQLISLRKIGENKKTQSYCLANIFKENNSKEE